jgi:type III secretion protein V
MIEDSVRRAVTRTPAGSFLALAPAVARDVVTAMGRAALEAEATGRTAKLVILTQADIRRFVRKLIEPDLPNIAVLSYQELLPEVALRSVARAHLGGIG